MSGDALLQIEGVSLSFSGVRALRDVSLSVSEGEVVAIIGPNGAGKTSLFNCISGVYRPQEGDLRFAGRSIRGVDPHVISAMGVGRMFQNLALFDHLTTLDNLLLGCHARYQSTWWQDALWSRRTRDEEVRHRREVEEVIDFLDLARYRRTPVGILPYGVLKRIELGRALVMKPKLLLLDEPAAGLNHEETEDLACYMMDIRRELGIAQLLIEHELRFVLDLADRVAVLDFGTKIAEGAPQEVAEHPRVIEAYVGGGEP